MIHFEERQTGWKRTLAYALFVAVALGAVTTSWLTLSHLSKLPRTTNALISADVAQIAFGLPGQVLAVHVDDDQAVKKGQLLLELDPTTYALLRDQAAAQVAAAQAAIRDAQGVVKAEKANAESAKAEIVRAKTNLSLAQNTVARLEPLAIQGITSEQSLEVAQSAAADAEVSLRVAEQMSSAANSLIKSTDSLDAALQASEAALAIAEHMLARTRIKAPFDGKISGLNIVAGTWVVPDIPVMSLIDDNSWYTEAFFPETELNAITQGQNAKVWVLSNSETALNGTIVSIGWGVQTIDAISLAGQVPFVAQTTDWVRLAKRYPVRIAFEGPVPDFLRVGASATVALID